VRVSKERDGMISPEVQRVAISDYAAVRGYVIAGWLEGIDESGSRARSAWWPRLDQAVAAVEAGEYDVILVWKFSRVARHRLRWAVAIDRVTEAGGRLESATEQIDTTTSAGRFTRGMFGEMNAFQAEMIGEGWKEAQQRRVKAGKPANGKPRWGYSYDRDQKLHVPDPGTGPVLAEMYRRYVAGESVYALVRWLNAHGWRTLEDNLWSARTLRRVLDSGFASGRFLAGGSRTVKPSLRPGVHEALIGEDLWQAYLDSRETRRAVAPRTERSQYLLSGMVRCAYCGRPMVANTVAYTRRHGGSRYRCKTSTEKGPEACRGGYVKISVVEDAVIEHVRQMAAAVDHVAEETEVDTGRVVSLVHEEQRLARELGRVDEALTRLAVQDAEHPLPPPVYAKARAELVDRVEGLQRSLDAAQREQRRAVGDRAVVAAGLLEEWDELAVSVRREVLRGLIDCVIVRTGRPLASYVRVVEWDEVRADL
jgi:site-specific DNA recombinase